MGFLSAAFFSWVQGAQFYIDAHSDAVDLLPSGNGKTWLDIRCGPGLVARLASRRGYRATGVDRDPRMIKRARYLAREEHHCRFELGELGTLPDCSADVVSAASLLFVVPEPASASNQLWNCVRPRGTLLIVETTEKMVLPVALAAMREVGPGQRLALALWAQARKGRAIASAVFDPLPAIARSRTLLLHGMLAAWSFTKGTK